MYFVVHVFIVKTSDLKAAYLNVVYL